MKPSSHRTSARLLAASVVLTVAWAQAAAQPLETPSTESVLDDQDPPKPKRVPKPVPKQGDDPKGSKDGEETGGPAPGGPTFVGEKDPKAKLTIDFGQEKHNFGEARQGDILEHVFELVSAGENPVKIRQASPTCGCTVTGVKIEGPNGDPIEYELGDPIEPGKKVFIAGKLDTASKQNKTQVRINVYTNDPIGLTQLALAADIEPFLRVTPPFVNLGDIKEGESKTQFIDVRTAQGQPIGLELDPANPIQVPAGMDIALSPINPGQDGRSGHWRATVTIGEGAKEGAIGYQLRLRSDVSMPNAVEKSKEGKPGWYTATSSINGRILGALSFTPQFVSLGLVRPGQRVPRNVKVISHDPGFDLSKIEIELQGEQGKPLAWAEYFTTTIQPATGLANAVDIQLRLEGLPDGSEGSFRGVMLIKTGHAKKPELQVRFSGVCRSGVKTPTPVSKGGQ